MDFWEKGNSTRNRKAIYLPMEGSREHPSILLFHNGNPDRVQLRELAQKALENQGVPKEDHEKIIEMAEAMYEHRLKTRNASIEIRRRMAGHIPLMRKSNGKWVCEKGHPLLTSYRQVGVK